MDSMSHSSVFSFDPNTQTITRHTTDSAVKADVRLDNESVWTLRKIRAGFVRLNDANPQDIESSIAAWQHLLATYFAAWEE